MPRSVVCRYNAAMLRRWVIRSFFIGLVLLIAATIAAWSCSYSHALFLHLPCPEPETVQKEFCIIGGQIIFQSHQRINGCFVDPNTLSFQLVEYDSWAPRFLDDPTPHDRLWFSTIHKPDESRICIPLWLPILVAAFLLWLFWRKTRPRAVGRAFPVEVKQAEATKP